MDQEKEEKRECRGVFRKDSYKFIQLNFLEKNWKRQFHPKSLAGVHQEMKVNSGERSTEYGWFGDEMKATLKSLNWLTCRGKL